MPRIITIQKGDTLWTLAKNNLPEGTDIRTYIEEICSHNNLSGSILIPGQKLELP
ncbi:MAG: LysM peptidoglycan-binding domain-containing protein [Bacillota bacterium]|nr:LysM peptidoglycan-binding domain-containing protein [Bacillota bacterium]HHU30473.1 LysM peptidoglycan-binding domain-containing protein [Bacillota bacterium]